MTRVRCVLLRVTTLLAKVQFAPLENLYWRTVGDECRGGSFGELPRQLFAVKIAGVTGKFGVSSLPDFPGDVGDVVFHRAAVWLA